MNERSVIAELGFAEIDQGALPGLCDHVPYLLDPGAFSRIVVEVTRPGIRYPGRRPRGAPGRGR